VVITQAQFDLEMGRVQERFRQSGRSPGQPELAQIRQAVLDNLIARELLYQESKKKGFKGNEEEVNGQLKALRARFPSEAEFQTGLTKMNITEADLRSQIEQDITIRQFINDTFVDKVTVSEAEIKAYYDNNPQFFTKPEQIRASHILIKVEPQADAMQKDRARKALKKVQQKLQTGEDFGALAKEFSQGPSAPKGGDLGFFGRGQMVKPFEDKAFAMKTGEVSDIVETQFGYHLIKVTDKKPESTLTFVEVKERLGEHLKQQKVQQEIGAYVEKLRVDAKVETYQK
jgi:peptidyl-prolyl cis-trans isomerase C